MDTIHLGRSGSVLESKGLRRRPVRLSVGVALGLGVLLVALLLLSASGAQARAGLAPAAAEDAASQGIAARRWLSETVDNSGDVGRYNSLALEPVVPYTPHISYYDGDGTALKHAWWTPAGWLSETVDDSGNVGTYTSLALESTSPYTPHISYCDGDNTALKHAWWTPSGWLSETVDSTGNACQYTSLALEPSPSYIPHISYQWGLSNPNLKHAWWTPSGWLSETVESAGTVGKYNSLALEPTPPYTAHISYQWGLSDPDLKHAWWTPGGWLNETVDSAGYVGYHTSLALAPTPPYTPHISYQDGWLNYDLKYAWWTSSGWLNETVDSTMVQGGYCTSLALEPISPYTPHISYLGLVVNPALKYTQWTSSGWLSETVDGTGDVGGYYTSLALEPVIPYAPHISYYDEINGALKHAWLAPEPPCLAYGWAQSSAGGFGDTGNVIVSSLGVHNGQLLAGTMNDGGSQLWRLDGGWTLGTDFGTFMSTTVGINHIFPFDGRTYRGTWDETQGGGIWRTLSSTSPTWESIMLDGFGDPGNKEVFRFVEFGGQLYASTWKYDGTGMEIWRSATGDTSSWSQVFTDGFGDLDNQVALSFETFNGYLYAGTYNEVTGGEMWRSSDGTTWSQVNADGFGTADNRGVSALEAFDGWLYASTLGSDSPAGAQVWRCQVCDNSDWELVVDNGFGNPDTRGMNGLEVFDGHLYFVVGNSTTGMEVWRTANGVNWQQVAPAGFGNSSNVAPYWGSSMIVFDNTLYVGTWNWVDGGEVWQSVCLPYGTYLPLALRGN